MRSSALGSDDSYQLEKLSRLNKPHSPTNDHSYIPLRNEDTVIGAMTVSDHLRIDDTGLNSPGRKKKQLVLKQTKAEAALKKSGGNRRPARYREKADLER